MVLIDKQLVIMKAINQRCLICLCVTNLKESVTTNLDLHMYSVLVGGRSHGRSTGEVSRLPKGELT